MLRLLALCAVALGGLGSTAYVTLGHLRPEEPATPAPAAVPLRPSYLVAVREPTPEELEQRRALARAKPAPRVVDTAPSASVEVAALAPVAPPSVATAAVVSDVNVRSGPSSESDTLSVASAGSEVEIVEEDNGWTRVTLEGGSVGWIANRFLER